MRLNFNRSYGAVALAAVLFFGVAVITESCASRTPRKAAADSLFLSGKAVNDAYAGYLDGIFDKSIKTNSFPKVTADYELFQQFFSTAVKELPGTNGVKAAVVMGAQVINDIGLAKKGVLK